MMVSSSSSVGAFFDDETRLFCSKDRLFKVSLQTLNKEKERLLGVVLSPFLAVGTKKVHDDDHTFRPRRRRRGGHRRYLKTPPPPPPPILFVSFFLGGPENNRARNPSRTLPSTCCNEL